MTPLNTSSSDDQLLAQSSAATLERYGAPLPCVCLVGDGLDCPIPSVVANHLVKTLQMTAEGVPVDVVPTVSELTVPQAAKFLGLREGHVLEMLHSNIIESRQVGDQTMVQRDSLVKFEQQFKKGRAAVAEMTRLAQEMGLYDD